MRTGGSNRNLRKASKLENQAASTNRDASANRGATTPSEIHSWQPRVLTVESLWQNCWLVDSAADVHIYNDKLIMTVYQRQPTKVSRSTLHRVSPGRKRVCFRLELENGLESLILNLENVYYLPNSPYNLLSLGLLNNSGIFYDNKYQNLHQVTTKRVLAQAKRWRNSYLLRPLNLIDGVVHLLRVNAETYQPSHVLCNSTTPSFAPLPLSIWYKHLGHSNFSSLKTHLNRLNIKLDDDSDGYICDSYLQAKATKTYHRDPQKRSKKPYQFVHTNLVGPIHLIGFLGEKYFFTFTDNATRMTETYTGTKKSDWLKCLKIYHSWCRTRSKEKHPIERLRLDYRTELQSHKADE